MKNFSQRFLFKCIATACLLISTFAGASNQRPPGVCGAGMTGGILASVRLEGRYVVVRFKGDRIASKMPAHQPEAKAVLRMAPGTKYCELDPYL